MATITAEHTWLTSTTPGTLLLAVRGRWLPRQRRLFAVACCRRVLDRLTGPASRRAVEVAELFADGAVDGEALRAAHDAAREVAQQFFERAQRSSRVGGTAAWDAWRLAYAAQLTCGNELPEGPSEAVIKCAIHVSAARGEEEMQVHCDLIRDIFGNPFRPRPAVDLAWLAWEGRTVPRLARAAYDERAFDRLPVVADALEEAGCTDDALLGHLRAPTAHARGCWALDLLLGVG